ncbi:M20/M25/M40 family metallo-hydrolase [Deinococcus aestuarii]|uniref:M20/M25/M40 family metallo-hydrolase n=1 Tax=Deinococcus aestuarii TaxID=2774531 RepID=UPI001C0C136C|nr:M20/M25/M40 family metallo-hydrolase [Deinococcus aestuarii]
MKRTLLAAALLGPLLGSCDLNPPPAQPQSGELALQHVQFLSQEIGSRVGGSQGEQNAAAYSYSVLRESGYAPRLQAFEYTGEGSVTRSLNVVGSKAGQSAREIIVIAHMDTVSVGRGADDNASGVGVLLEAAQRLRQVQTPYTLRFIVAGSEEDGLRGSRDYASRMSAGEVANTVLVINLDSLLAGDQMYVYGEGAQGAASRDDALSWAGQHGLNVITQPGENPEYPAGTTGDWSDHAPFKKLGLSYAYLEATNWTLGDKDGYTQTEKHGEIWHTENDTLAFLNREFPGRVQQHLEGFSDLLVHMLSQPPAPAATAQPLGLPQRVREVPAERWR